MSEVRSFNHSIYEQLFTFISTYTKPTDFLPFIAACVEKGTIITHSIEAYLVALNLLIISQVYWLMTGHQASQKAIGGSTINICKILLDT